MKYCINYLKKTDKKYIDEADEISINFRPSDLTLPAFIEQHIDQRINLNIQDPKDFINQNRIKLISALAEKYNADMALKIPGEYTKDEDTRKIVEIINQEPKKINYFFDQFADSWDTFWGLLSLNPSDIYIVEELGFNIAQCAEKAHSQNTRIRVFPNVAQSSWDDSPAIKKFFIRPEDTPYYEPFVDVFEFFSLNNRQSTFFRIYKHDKKWAGNLNELIISLHADIDSRTVLSTFAKHRLSCGKKCIKGNPCNICERIENLSTTLSNRDLLLKELQNRTSKEKL